MRLGEYGIAVGGPADLMTPDAQGPAETVAALAQPLWGVKRGRLPFTWPRPALHRPGQAP